MKSLEQLLQSGAELCRKVRAVVRFHPHDSSTEHGRARERYRRMALTTMASLTARGIGLLATLVSVPLTFRYLGAERYGLWMVLVSFISAMSFADLGIGNGVMNAISEAYGKDDRELAREYVSSGVALMLAIAAILAVAGAIAFPLLPWERLFNVRSVAVAGEGAKAFLVLFAWFVVNIPLGVITRVQAGLQKGYWSQIVGAAGNVGSLLGILVVIQLRGSLPWLVFASTSGVILATAVNGWLLFRAYPWLTPSMHAFRSSSAQKILRLGLMFFVLQVAVALGYTSDNIVITQVMGAAAVAVYAVPQKLFSFVSQLVSMGISPLWPAYGEAIARGDVAWVRRTFWASIRLTLAATVPLCAGLAIAGPWILRVMVGKSLHAPVSLLAALAVWGGIAAVSTPMAMLLNGAGILKVQTVISGIASVSNLIVSILLTRRLGVVGVCLGSVLTQVTLVFPAYFFVIRKLFREMSGARMASDSSLQIDLARSFQPDLPRKR
jgi:O-antigen/teichoic acid export membrane protein